MTHTTDPWQIDYPEPGKLFTFHSFSEEFSNCQDSIKLTSSRQFHPSNIRQDCWLIHLEQNLVSSRRGLPLESSEKFLSKPRQWLQRTCKWWIAMAMFYVVKLSWRTQLTWNHQQLQCHASEICLWSFDVVPYCFIL